LTRGCVKSVYRRSIKGKNQENWATERTKKKHSGNGESGKRTRGGVECRPLQGMQKENETDVPQERTLKDNFRLRAGEKC